METVIGITLAVAAYLVGSVSPSYLLVRFKTGEDVRQMGSRNAGTLNTYHRLGIAGGLVVLAADAGKARWPSWYRSLSALRHGPYSRPLPWF